MKNNYQNNNNRAGRGGEVGIGASGESSIMSKFGTGSHTPNPMTSLLISKVLQDKSGKLQHKTDPRANSNNSNNSNSIGSGESLIVHDAKGAPPKSGTFFATIVSENIQDTNNNNTGAINSVLLQMVVDIQVQ